MPIANLKSNQKLLLVNCRNPLSLFFTMLNLILLKPVSPFC